MSSIKRLSMLPGELRTGAAYIYRGRPVVFEKVYPTIKGTFFLFYDENKSPIYLFGTEVTAEVFEQDASAK